LVPDENQSEELIPDLETLLSVTTADEDNRVQEEEEFTVAKVIALMTK